jgi:sugar phosphate isomerase/epimerase
MRNKTGLVSISFRKFSPEEIIEHVVQAGLDGIEWGGDVHAPHGQTKICREVAKRTFGEGLEVLAYGSYFRLAEEESPKFSDVLKSAMALGAPCIRVWAGKRASKDVDDAYFAKLVEGSYRIAEDAASEGIQIAYEFHSGTMTDSIESTTRLLGEVKHPNVLTLWQPINHECKDVNLKAIEAVADRLLNVRVYQWLHQEGKNIREALEGGRSIWSEYIQKIYQCAPGDRAFLLEFVKDDAIEQFFQDSLILKEILADK